MRRLILSALRAKSKLSYAASIAAGLVIFEGLQLLINAASMPLETVSARLINALLVRGWRNVMLLSEPSHSLLMVGSIALTGVVLVAIGFSIGEGVVRHTGAEDRQQ